MAQIPPPPPMPSGPLPSVKLESIHCENRDKSDNILQSVKPQGLTNDMNAALQNELKNTLKKKKTKSVIDEVSPIVMTNGFKQAKTFVIPEQQNKKPLDPDSPQTDKKDQQFTTKDDSPDQKAIKSNEDLKNKNNDALKINEEEFEKPVKSKILTTNIKNGDATIRPSRIKTLQRNGSYVTQEDLVEYKPQVKSPIMLIEPIFGNQKVAKSAPVSPKFAPRINENGDFSKVIQSRNYPVSVTTNDFDHKVSIKSAPVSPRLPKANIINPETRQESKRLMISHGKPNFVINRTKSCSDKSKQNLGTKQAPVFKILLSLEAMENKEKGGTDKSRESFNNKILKFDGRV